MGATITATPRGHIKAPRKASPHSESGGRTSPAPPTKAIAHPFWGPWGLFGIPTLGHYFWARLCPRLPMGTPRSLVKPRPIPSLADELRSCLSLRLCPPVLEPLGPFGIPTFRAVFLGGAMLWLLEMHPKASCKASYHSEFGG